MASGHYIWVLFSFLTLSKAQYQLSTLKINATKGQDIVFMCTATTRFVQFQNKDTGSVTCLITSFNSNQTCTFSGTYNTQYQYRCFPTNSTVMITIPGRNVTESLHGTRWECFNPIDQPNTQSNIKNIFVNVPISAVSIRSTPEDKNLVAIVEGYVQKFYCYTDEGRPPSTIDWYLSSRKLSPANTTLQITCSTDCGNDMVISNSTLRYIGKKLDSNMEIYCKASNSEDQNPIESTKKTLEIWFPPEVNPTVEQTPSGPIQDGAMVTLTCSVSGGIPLPTLRWNCTGSSIDIKSGNLVVSNITFNATKNDNQKKCVCSGTHPAVLYRPTIIHTLVIYYEPSTLPKIMQFPPGPISNGTKVTLTCSVTDGNPLAVLSWNCSGDRTNNTLGNTASYSVEFSIDETYNNMICTCSGSQEFSSYKPNIHHRLVVYYKPGKILNITQTPEGHLINGTKVTLTCSVSGGNPLAVLSWNCTGNNVNNTSGNTASYSVEFTVDKTFNNRRCTCSATHNIDSYRPTVDHLLIVNYTPEKALSISQIPEESIIDGDSVTLTCSVSGGNPLAILSWNCTGLRKNSTSADTASYSIVLTVNKTFNNRICTCTGSHIISSYKPMKHHTLIVYYTPSKTPTIRQNPEGPIINGTKVSLTCSVPGGNPLAVLSWNCSGNYTNNTSLNTASYSVDFTVDKTYNNRICTCSSRHIISSYNATITHGLVVYFAPDVTVYTQSESFLEGHSLTLLCNATGNPPDYTYSGWSHVYGGSEIRKFDTTSNKLLLNRLSYQDIGTYSCAVTNNIPDSSGNKIRTSTIYIDVNFSPAVINFTHVISAKAGTNVTAFVDLFSFPDLSKPVQWRNSSGNDLKNLKDVSFTLLPRPLNTTFHKINVFIDKYSYRTALHFYEFQLERDGYYTLQVHNSIGEKNVTLRVVLSDVPETPYDFSKKLVSSSMVLLSWTAGFNGGNPQTFIISYLNKKDKRMMYVKKEETDGVSYYELIIENLRSSTVYEFTLTASNIEGNDSAVNNSLTIRTDDLTEFMNDGNAGLIGGAVGGSISAFLIVASVVLLFRRYKAKDEDESRKKLEQVKQDDNCDEGLKDNILYVSAGPRLHNNSESGGVEYAVVNKKDTKLGFKSATKVQETALFTDVQRKSKKKKKGEIYTNIQTTKKEGKGKEKAHPHNRDEIYENMEKNDYESVQQRSDNRHRDGLQYADLVFNPKPDGAKFVIHGLNDRTIYAEVDTTQKIDPLPDSDNESAEVIKPTTSRGAVKAD